MSAPTCGPRAAGLALRGVRKSFGTVEVIKGVDLSVAAGEFVVFVGPSGCGKSTLLRMIAGLEEVTDGEIAIGGRDVTDASPAARGIAMVFQSYALYPHMSVAENLGFGLRMSHRPASEVAAKVRAAAEVLHLVPLLDRRPGQLSGGQRQRVAIGRAIVRDPQVFLFDEPLSNLDAELRVEMRLEIARLHRRLGNTMVYVTHDQTEAMTLADTIVVLRGGVVEQVGSPAALYDDPDNLFVAGFIGSPKTNLLPVRWEGETLLFGDTAITPPPVAGAHRAATLAVRPEHLRIARDGEVGLPFRLDVVEFLGGSTFLYGDGGEGRRLVVAGERGPPPPPGTRLVVAFDPADARLFDAGGRRLR